MPSVLFGPHPHLHDRSRTTPRELDAPRLSPPLWEIRGLCPDPEEGPSLGAHSARKALQGARRETHPSRCDEIDLRRQPLGRGDADSSTEATTRQRGLTDDGVEERAFSPTALHENNLEPGRRSRQHDARESTSRSNVDNHPPLRIETRDRREGLSVVPFHDLIGSSRSDEGNRTIPPHQFLIVQPELPYGIVRQLDRRAASKP